MTASWVHLILFLLSSVITFAGVAIGNVWIAGISFLVFVATIYDHAYRWRVP